MLQSDIQKIRDDAEKLANKQQRKLMLAYKKSLDSVRGDMGVIYSKHAIDGVLSVSNKQRLSILKSLDGQLRTMYGDLGKLDQSLTFDILSEAYKTSFYKTIYTIDKGIDAVVSFDVLNPKIIDKVVNVEYKGELFSNRIWDNKKLMITRLKDNLNRAVLEGKSIDELSKDISKTFGSAAYESKRLMTTELARVVSEAQSSIYADSEVVRKVMYDATLDNSTSDICQELDGKTFNANESYPMPPQHPNCRSCIIPVVDGWSPTKKLDNETKKVIDYATYEKWKAKRT